MFGKEPNANQIFDKMHRKIYALDAPDGGISAPHTRGWAVDPGAEDLGVSIKKFVYTYSYILLK